MNLTPDTASGKPVYYAARQPILTAEERVFGYELLFRDGMKNYFSSSDPDGATRTILDTSSLLGLDVLCDGRLAFINCTRDILLEDYVKLLPSDRVVVEILESVPPDDLVMQACHRLRCAGYKIALDDFTVGDPREPFTDLTDIIKVDWRQTSISEAAKMVTRYRRKNCLMLAEKVETREDFVAARKAGFEYFQGYFFRKPELMQARQIPRNQATHLQILKAISRPELDCGELEDLVKKDASLYYRLLRHLNSPIFGLRGEIRSVRQALTILGDREVRHWFRLAATLAAGQARPSDLILTALVRARFSELLGLRVEHGGSDLFLVGLLSLMDAILQVPMYIVLDGIPLDHESKSVLLGNQSPISPLYELVMAHEAANWQASAHLSNQLDLPEEYVGQCHWSAMQWAHEATNVA